MSASHLTEYLRDSARRFPNRVAVVGPRCDTLTFADLDRQSDALANSLSARDVIRGDRVGVVLPKGIAAVVAIFGILKSGAAYVPVDHTAPAERGKRILTDCRVSAVIVDSRCLDMVADVGPQDDRPKVVVVVVGPFSAGGPELTRHATAFDAAIDGIQNFVATDRGPDDLAYILYTSGSTGLPKGVMISHRNVVSFIDWCSSQFDPTPEDRFGNHAPFHFDASVLDLYLSIKHGATVHLISEDLGKNPRDLASFIVKQALTIWFSTPSILSLLVQYGDLDAQSPPHLRLVLFGGEVFPVKRLRELQRRWSSAVFYNLYGPTETTVACTFARIPEVIPDDRTAPYPIGAPCTHCQALVLDADGHAVAVGEEGQLYVSGPSVFLGYWNRPAENDAAFVVMEGMRWYKTGDVVRCTAEEGFLYVGRQDRMVKRRGYRIELGEIESALLAHSRVSEAAVTTIPDTDAGVRVIAFVSCMDAKPLSIVELKTFCATKVPTYMSPDQFVFKQRLPRTSSDKIDYQALRKQLLDARARSIAG